VGICILIFSIQVKLDIVQAWLTIFLFEEIGGKILKQFVQLDLPKR